MRVNNFNLRATTMMFNDSFGSIKSASSMTPAEETIELASRLCYNSVAKLGTNPKFINGLIKAGHLDVLEHAVAVFDIEFLLDDVRTDGRIVERSFLQLVAKYRYLGELVMEFGFADPASSYEGSLHITIGGNLRVWLEIIHDIDEIVCNGPLCMILPELYEWLRNIAPNIFEEEPKYIKQFGAYDEPVEIKKAFDDLVNKHNRSIILEHDHTATNATILPVAYNHHFIRDSRSSYYNHMSYWLSTVSRAFSHQHARHRTLSLSQLSQRYVDFVQRQYGNFVMPLDITEEQKKLLRQSFSDVVELYTKLRDSGMKKEDARCILPNAATTALIFSGWSNGLEHYFKLRTATDAQEEIRLVALVCQQMYRKIYK